MPHAGIATADLAARARHEPHQSLSSRATPLGNPAVSIWSRTPTKAWARYGKGITIALLSRAMAAIRAKARPFNVAPVPSVIA